MAIDETRFLLLSLTGLFFESSLRTRGRTVDCILMAYKNARTDKVASLTLRRLMSYIYGAPILDVSRSHTTTQHSR